MPEDLEARHTLEAFLLKPRGDKLIRLSISRNTLIAILCSLLLHALLLFLIVPHIPLNSASPPPVTIDVSLAPPKQPERMVEPIPPSPPPEPIKPEPIKKVVKKPPKVITQKRQPTTKPTFTVPVEIAREKPIPTPEPLPIAKDAPTDMASFIKAKQAARQAAESDAARQNAEAVAREIGPTEAQRRDERIKNNFQNGTNGIFEITSLNGRDATFSFLGWTNNLSNANKQFFEVAAKPGQDVRLVMIKRMIGLIREHYQGDFDWDSHRLGKVIKLSARLEDSAGLEDFMMIEFFGPNYKN